MNKHLTNKMMETDIRKAKANIYDHRAIDKLKENLGGAWKPKDFNQSNEDHHLLNLANYLIEVSTLAEITTMLRKAIDAKNHKKTKELIYQFKKVLKTLPVRGEEDREIFHQIQQKLTPLLDTLGKTKDQPHLTTHAENLSQLIHQKLEPPKWKHAA